MIQLGNKNYNSPSGVALRGLQIALIIAGYRDLPVGESNFAGLKLDKAGSLVAEFSNDFVDRTVPIQGWMMVAEDSQIHEYERRELAYRNGEEIRQLQLQRESLEAQLSALNDQISELSVGNFQAGY